MIAMNGQSTRTVTDRLLTPAQVEEAALLPYTSRRTLARWRQEGSGPPWFTIRGRVVYRQSAITSWIAAQEARR